MQMPQKLGAEINTYTTVTGFMTEGNKVTGVITDKGKILQQKL